MKAQFIQSLSLGSLRELSLIKNEQGCRLTTTKFSCTALIIPPEIGKNISAIHTPDRDWHLRCFLTTRESDQFLYNSCRVI